jgi:hypothetical protein
MLVLITILAFTTYRLIVLATKSDPEVSKQSFMRDLDASPPLKPGDYGFNIAFGIGKPLDMSYGKFIVSTVSFGF